MNKEILQDKFLSNLEYILIELEKDINKANRLEDKMYFELSKKEIMDNINDVYLKLKKWPPYYETKNYELIINEYKEIESIVSELELCLAGLDDLFHMSGISYSLFEIGKKLLDIKKECGKDGK